MTDSDNIQINRVTKLSRGAAKAGRKPKKQTNEQSKELDLKRSLARAEALESIFKMARHGTIVTLWRDLLKSNRTMWSNIRKGTALFNDELARKAEVNLGLPEGWLDNPTHSAPTLENWVTDPKLPRPTRPTHKLEYGVISEMNQQDSLFSKSRTIYKEVPKPIKITDKKVQDLSSTSSTGFLWEPKSNPQPIDNPGPIVEALTNVIASLSKEGKLTEQDALRLLNQLINSA